MQIRLWWAVRRVVREAAATSGVVCVSTETERLAARFPRVSRSRIYRMFIQQAMRGRLGLEVRSAAYAPW